MSSIEFNFLLTKASDKKDYVLIYASLSLSLSLSRPVNL